MENRIVIALLVGMPVMGFHAAEWRFATNGWEYATNPWDITPRERKLAWKQEKLRQERAPYASSNYTLEELGPIALGREKFNKDYYYQGRAPFPGGGKDMNRYYINKNALEQNRYAGDEILRRYNYEKALERKIHNLQRGYTGRFSDWLSSKWYGTAR